MKAIFYLASVMALLSLSSSARAETWTTNDGVVYQDVKVIRVEDDAITILYRDGGALVPLFKLPPDLQQKFDYDPAKAKVAAEARMKADAENAKELQAEIELYDKMRRTQQIADARARNSTNAPTK